ncbi:hypothetical protein LMG24076_01578 [Trinickia soli]|nr:hypothetical protein LMG24076_01578 [Trinickia soli]
MNESNWIRRFHLWVSIASAVRDDKLRGHAVR